MKWNEFRDYVDSVIQKKGLDDAEIEYINILGTNEDLSISVSDNVDPDVGETVIRVYNAGLSGLTGTPENE